MSTVADLAAEEAARAEAEEEETGDAVETEEEQETQTTDDEPEGRQEPAQAVAAPTEAQIEAALKSLEREAERHAREVSKRAGPFLPELHPCPLCFTPGFTVTVPAGAFDPERRQAVMVAMGEPPEPPYRTAKDAVTCDDCDGWGLVLTGSKSANFVTKPCTRCTGSGWINPPVQLAPPPVIPPTFPGPVLAGVPYDPSLPTDQWGRPSGHPHYGIRPADVGA